MRGLFFVLVYRAKPPAGAGTVASGSKFSPEFTHQIPEMTKHSRSVTVCGALSFPPPALPGFNGRSATAPRLPDAGR
jgi:hypothetical protein